MIRLLIPSYNRACQLELLLRSVDSHWSLKDLDVNVVYKGSDDLYVEGYQKVINMYPSVNFIPEGDFSEQMKSLVKDSPHDCIGFGVDDCVMFRTPNVDVNDVCRLLTDEKYVGFSLRLGTNTVVQNYLTGQLQPRLEYKDTMPGIIEWNWKRYPRMCNWAYWFSWDFHFYRKDLLTSERVFAKHFGIHRELEGSLSIDDYLFSTLPNKMLACKDSSVFVNTVNTVQTDGVVPAGIKHSYSTKDLNNRFLSGEHICLEIFNRQNVISCHEEYGLEFENATTKR